MNNVKEVLMECSHVYKWFQSFVLRTAANI